MDVREKLVAMIVKVSHECDDFYNLWEIGENAEEIAANLIANGVTVQEWISVGDRLPKSMANKVIVRCKNGYVGFGHYEDYKGTQTWYNLGSQEPFSAWDYEAGDYEVTHWMPLPPLPQLSK